MNNKKSSLDKIGDWVYQDMVLSQVWNLIKVIFWLFVIGTCLTAK